MKAVLLFWQIGIGLLPMIGALAAAHAQVNHSEVRDVALRSLANMESFDNFYAEFRFISGYSSSARPGVPGEIDDVRCRGAGIWAKRRQLELIRTTMEEFKMVPAPEAGARAMVSTCGPADLILRCPDYTLGRSSIRLREEAQDVTSQFNPWYGLGVISDDPIGIPGNYIMDCTNYPQYFDFEITRESNRVTIVVTSEQYSSVKIEFDEKWDYLPVSFHFIESDGKPGNWFQVSDVMLTEAGVFPKVVTAGGGKRAGQDANAPRNATRFELTRLDIRPATDDELTVELSEDRTVNNRNLGGQQTLPAGFILNPERLGYIFNSLAEDRPIVSNRPLPPERGFINWFTVTVGLCLLVLTLCGVRYWWVHR